MVLLSKWITLQVDNSPGDMTSSETGAVYQSNLFCMHTRGLFFFFYVGVIPGITEYAGNGSGNSWIRPAFLTYLPPPQLKC